MKKRKVKLMGEFLTFSVFLILFLITFISAEESCYIQININETIQGNAGYVALNIDSIENLYGDYSYFVEIYNPEFGNTYKLSAYNRQQTSIDLIGEYSFSTNLFSYYDNFGNTNDSGGIISFNKSTTSVIMPYNPNVNYIVVTLADGSTRTLNLDSSSIKCERTCKNPGEIGRWDNDRCCGGFSRAEINTTHFNCINCGNGTCDANEDRYNCWGDCGDSNFTCSANMVKDDYGCVECISDFNCEGGEKCVDEQCVPKGTGTSSNPYLIYTCQDLQNIKNNLGASYALAKDIDCSETYYWNCDLNETTCSGFQPMGTGFGITGSFTGNFDGKGFAISNLYIHKNASFVGLFGSIYGGEIKNVNILEADVYGKDNYLGILAGASSANIRHVYVSGNIGGKADRVGCITGIIGNMGNLENSYSACNINIKGNMVGGLVGINSGGLIYNSVSTGFIEGNFAVGGIVGYLSFTGKIISCKSLSKIYANMSSNGGGIVSKSASKNESASGIAYSPYMQSYIADSSWYNWAEDDASLCNGYTPIPCYARFINESEISWYEDISNLGFEISSNYYDGGSGITGFAIEGGEYAGSENNVNFIQRFIYSFQDDPFFRYRAIMWIIVVIIIIAGLIVFVVIFKRRNKKNSEKEPEIIDDSLKTSQEDKVQNRISVLLLRGQKYINEKRFDEAREIYAQIKDLYSKLKDKAKNNAEPLYKKIMDFYKSLG